MVETNQQTIHDALNQSVLYEWQRKSWKEIMWVVSYCITKDLLPLHMVEKKGFHLTDNLLK